MTGAIELSFVRDTAAPRRKGPYPLLRLEGEIIRTEPGGPVIAKHVGHEWHVDGERYSRLESECRVLVHFERVDGSRSKTFGPYERMSFIDGVAYMEHLIFAFIDRSIVDWYCHEDERHWPLMIIQPVEGLIQP